MISQELKEKVIALYSRGMSTRDIHSQIKDIYGIELSAERVSKITDSLLPEIEEWQNRPLELIYSFIFMVSELRLNNISTDSFL